MKNYLFLLLVMFCGNVSAQEYTNLDSLLSVVYQRDQQVRKDIIRIQKMQPINPDSIRMAALNMAMVDAENVKIITGLLDDKGWPVGISSASSNTISVVIDHAGRDVMKRYMPLIESQMLIGVVSKNMYATMLDRVLMYDRLPQRYGTQTVMNTIDGKTIIWLWPVEDAEKLDELRREMELVPIDDYSTIIKETFGADLVWDKNKQVADFPVYN